MNKRVNKSDISDTPLKRTKAMHKTTANEKEFNRSRKRAFITQRVIAVSRCLASQRYISGLKDSLDDDCSSTC